MACKLPERVVLPNAVTITHQHLCLALGVSKHALYYYRKYHNWPQPIRNGRSTFSITSEIAGYLRNRGVNVEVI